MDDNRLLAYSTTIDNSQQAEKLFLLIEECLKESGLKLTDIDIVSVTNGPGSFTGVRIGLAAALGLKMGIKAKIIALSNFQVVAWQAAQEYPNKQIAVVLDARREQVYYQLFDENLKNLTEPKLVEIENFILPESTILVGDGWKNNLMINADAKILASATKIYWESELYSDLTPLYIREPDAALPAK